MKPNTGLGDTAGAAVVEILNRLLAGTNDFLTGLMEQHEKMAWMLRAFVA